MTIAVTEEGCTCPTCGQFVKLYRRSLNCMMARILILIHRHFDQPHAEEWLHVPRYLASKSVVEPGGDVGKLAHWGLLDALSGERPDGCKHNGFYKITPLGTQFVQRKVQVPKYIFLYNQTVYGFSNGSDRPMGIEVRREMTGIREALGRKFNYSELMGLPQLELL